MDTKKSFAEVISKYNGNIPNGDYSSCDFEGVSLYGCKFHKDCILPNDRDLFQKIRFKSLSLVTLPEMDLRGYNFNDVSLHSVKFPKKCRLPEERNLFLKLASLSLIGVTLPSGDYSKYSFDGIILMNTTFTKDSKLPKNRDFFRKLFRAQAYKCILPEGNYMGYDTIAFSTDKCKFLGDSIPPIAHILTAKKENFDVYLKRLLDNNGLYEICVDNLDMSGLDRLFRHSSLSLEQKDLLGVLVQENNRMIGFGNKEINKG